MWKLYIVYVLLKGSKLSQEITFVFVVRSCWFQISEGTSTLLTNVSHYFCQFLPVNATVISQDITASFHMLFR
jgi:hypothetical protein